MNLLPFLLQIIPQHISTEAPSIFQPPDPSWLTALAAVSVEG
jgi:hypothetical protein